MDSVIVFPPGPSTAGSQLQIGTYIMYDPGPNFGAAGLISNLKTNNALRDGGVFSRRIVPQRTMAFPLLLRDVPGQTLLQTESLLREWVAPGAAIAIQPENVPSGEAVFFDVLDGRWEFDYNPFENRIGRRKGTLYVDTQPWGYWPTEMLLASSASVGQFGQLAVNGASVIGDVPPLAHLIISPTVASAYAPGIGSGYAPDMAAYSLGARPSFTPYANPTYTGTGAAGVYTASLVADKYAPGGMARVLGGGGIPSIWLNIADTGTWIASAIEPAYRGRFRVFAFGRFLASYGGLPPMQLIVDADRPPPTVGALNSLFPLAMASSNQIATVAQVILPSGNALSASPGYQMVDAGEITLPPTASGYQGPVRLRVWANWAGTTAGSVLFAYGGLYLLPIDGAAGIQTRGMYVPTLYGGGVGALELNNGFSERVDLMDVYPGAATGQTPYDGRSYFRGVMPRIGASTNSLTLLTADRQVGNFQFVTGTYMVAAANVEYSQVSISYRPTFQFMHGL